MTTNPDTLTIADYRGLLGRSKYGNQKTEVDNVVFASKREANRYQELCLLLAGGQIADLVLQPRWPLVVNGVKVATYVGDFAYTDRVTGRLTVEDAKGVRTPVYRLKAKLMLACHGLEITEV